MKYLTHIQDKIKSATKQFGIFVFVEAQETNSRGDLQRSKCDGNCIFL